MDKISGGIKKKLFSIFAILCVLFVSNIVLFAFSIISLLLFLVILFSLLLVGLFSVIWYLKNKKRKVQKIKSNLANIVISDQDIIDLFNKTGLPIIYDENGKVKDIFKLLGIEPKYDELGNRILTIYEKLGIVPRFDQNGKEIPTFLSIKNRVHAFVKPEKKTGVLTRVLTEQEKEELLIRQMLEQKLKESEQKGDVKKTKVIKKVIEQKKKEKTEAPKKQGYIKLAKAAKPIATPKAKLVKTKPSGYNPIADISTIFNIGIERIVMPRVKYKINKEEPVKPKVQGHTTLVENIEKPKEPKPNVKTIVIEPVKSKQKFLNNLSRQNSIITGLNHDNVERNQ